MCMSEIATVQYLVDLARFSFVTLDRLSSMLVLIKLLQLAGTGYEAIALLIKPVTYGPMVCIHLQHFTANMFISGSSSSHVASFPHSLIYDYY